MYHPNLGRWMTIDPVGYLSDSKNLYGYVRSSPVSNTDPSGLYKIFHSTPTTTIGDVFAPGFTMGVELEGNETVKFLQFGKVNAQIKCIKCDQVIHKESLKGKHIHDENHGYEYTGYDESKWFVDGNPYYPGYERQTLSESGNVVIEMMDFPIIAQELKNEYLKRAERLEQFFKKMYGTREVISCSVYVTATFHTYILINNKIVAKYVTTSEGSTVFNSVASGNIEMLPEQAAVFGQQYPKHPKPVK